MSALDCQPRQENHRLESLTQRCQELENQLRQARKMEVVGRLVSGVVHDFNNLLTVMVGYSDLLLLDLNSADPMRDSMEEIRKAALRAIGLTNRLLAFTRQKTPVPQAVDLNTFLTDMDKMLRRIVTENIELNLVLGQGLGRVKADPGQIEQVVLNLALNARDAMAVGGRLTVETANVELDEAYVDRHNNVVPGAYVLLAISDTGCGMDAQTKSHLFEPYFTTKDQGKGTGLGLVTVQEIVEESQGYIWVYSEPGLGTTFKIYLPRLGSAEWLPTPAPGVVAGPRGTETVLLVEDDAWIRDLARLVLQRAGYTVLEARQGSEALFECAHHPGAIDLLLTDVVMPQMNGRELADQLRPLRPDLRVLYMSGYTESAIDQQASLAPGTPFIQKPFTPEALMRKVRDVLDAGRVDEPV